MIWKLPSPGFRVSQIPNQRGPAYNTLQSSAGGQLLCTPQFLGFGLRASGFGQQRTVPRDPRRAAPPPCSTPKPQTLFPNPAPHTPKPQTQIPNQRGPAYNTKLCRQPTSLHTAVFGVRFSGVGFRAATDRAARSREGCTSSLPLSRRAPSPKPSEGDTEGEGKEHFGSPLGTLTPRIHTNRCRANMAHTRQSKSDSSLGCQILALVSRQKS